MHERKLDKGKKGEILNETRNESSLGKAGRENVLQTRDH
jgi:hypothetical protein